MKNSFLFATLLLSFPAFCQHYYNDIADARLMSDRMKTYTSQKVKTITASGFDARGAKTTDFNEWQEVNTDSKILKITTRNGQQVSRQYYQFDEQYRLSGIIDSSGDINSKTDYNYDPKGNMVSIVTTATDSLKDFSQTIAHHYEYDQSGKPVKLWRVVNGTDSTEYRFKRDEKGNVGDEQLYRRGVGTDLIYYYYDDENRLTDIVRYDKKMRRLLPVFMFEYDDKGRLIQKMSVLSVNNPDYIIWRYIFNEKGLKTKEALFNKQKELTGRIEYAYTFLP
jgi:hypothetical protein